MDKSKVQVNTYVHCVIISLKILSLKFQVINVVDILRNLFKK
jgi:hypothetical protein